MYHPPTITTTNLYYNLQDVNMIHEQQPSDMFIKKEQEDFTFNNDLLLTSGYYPHNNQLSDASNNLRSPDILTYPYQYDISCPSYSPSSTSNYSCDSFSPIESSTSFEFYPHFIEETSYFFQHQNNCDAIFKDEEWHTTLDSLLPTTTATVTAKPNDARPYPCHLCRRAFARKHDLQRHIRVHTGDKPYSCPCCKKAFARTDALKRHLRMEEHCRTSQEVQTMKKNGGRHFRNLKIHNT